MRGHIVPGVCVVGALVAIGLAATPLHAQQQGPDSAPEGEGRAIVMGACTACHAPSAFTHLRMGERAWRFQVYDMILRGAQISPNQIDAAVAYLTANYGPGVPFPGPPAPTVALPDGAGRELVEGGCALCHGLDRVTAARRSQGQWNQIVGRMVYLGAPLGPDQTKQIVAYLNAHFGVGAADQMNCVRPSACPHDQPGGL